MTAALAAAQEPRARYAPTHVTYPAGEPGPDAMRVTALADHEIAAWNEILHPKRAT